MGTNKLVNTVIDEGIILRGLQHPRPLELNIPHCLEHVHHPLNTQSLDTITERAEDSCWSHTLTVMNGEREREMYIGEGKGEGDREEKKGKGRGRERERENEEEREERVNERERTVSGRGRWERQGGRGRARN